MFIPKDRTVVVMSIRSGAGELVAAITKLALLLAPKTAPERTTALTAVAPDDGYWLSLDGHKKALINLGSHGKIVTAALEEGGPTQRARGRAGAPAKPVLSQPELFTVAASGSPARR